MISYFYISFRWQSLFLFVSNLIIFFHGKLFSHISEHRMCMWRKRFLDREYFAAVVVVSLFIIIMMIMMSVVQKHSHVRRFRSFVSDTQKSSCSSVTNIRRQDFLTHSMLKLSSCVSIDVIRLWMWREIWPVMRTIFNNISKHIYIFTHFTKSPWGFSSCLRMRVRRGKIIKIHNLKKILYSLCICKKKIFNAVNLSTSSLYY